MIRYDRDSPRAVDRGWPKAGFALTESAYRSAPARRFVESAPRCRPASCRSVSAYRSAVNRRSAPARRSAESAAANCRFTESAPACRSAAARIGSA
jgi:hypothetical protein